MTNHVPIYAHRGASSLALENTMKAFEMARQLGVDGIELDIQCTKDDVLVIYHDLDLFRLTGVKKNIFDCTYEELAVLPLGKNFLRVFSSHRIPLFEKIIEWANTYQIPLILEVKESLLNNNMPLIKLLQNLVLPIGSHITSFHEELLKIVKMQRPDIETALLVTKKFDWKQLDKSTHIDTINANKKYYKQEYLNFCEEAKKGIRFYGIKGSETFIKTPHPAVVGWITDYPQKVAKTQKNS